VDPFYGGNNDFVPGWKLAGCPKPAALLHARRYCEQTGFHPRPIIGWGMQAQAKASHTGGMKHGHEKAGLWLSVDMGRTVGGVMAGAELGKAA